MSQLLQYYRSFQNRNSISNNSSSNPTFEDLSIDEELTETQRLVKYVKSSIALQRLVHTKMIFEVAQSIGFHQTTQQIIPLLDALSKDSESPVKHHLLEVFVPLSKFLCSFKDDGYVLFITTILPLIARLLEDSMVDVRKTACRTLVDVSVLIHQDDLGQQLLPIILRLSHDDEKEELRMTASDLLNSLADVLGTSLCHQFLIPEIISLSEDPVFRVRKSAALNFSNICKLGGEHELFERLTPAFVRLSKDDVFRVRKACVESLSEISQYVNDDIRMGVLVEIFLRLTHDPSKPVRQATLQQSGRFICTLPKNSINSSILDVFCSMVNEPLNDPIIDAELTQSCSYFFPGVFQAIGKQRWLEIKPTYHSLFQSRIVGVRQNLAYSLHEIAKVFGDDTALIEEELLPVFEDIIQDIESVQIGVIKYISNFLKLLSVSVRVSYLPIIHDILHSTNPFNWRLRQTLAMQLPDLILLPPIECLYESLFPLIMTLLQDPVYCVRRNTYSGLSSMINLLWKDIGCSKLINNSKENNNSQHLKSIISTVNSLLRGTYQMRMLWVELVHVFFMELDKEILENNFVNGIVLLASDSVVNVRITVATLLTNWDSTFEPLSFSMTNNSSKSNYCWLFKRSDIHDSIILLSQDDFDVFTIILKLQIIFNDIDFKVVSKRVVMSEIGVPSPLKINIELIKLDLGSPIDIAHDPHINNKSNSNQHISKLPIEGLQIDELEYSLDKIDGLPDEILERDLLEHKTQLQSMNNMSDSIDNDDYDEVQQPINENSEF